MATEAAPAPTPPPAPAPAPAPAAKPAAPAPAPNPIPAARAPGKAAENLNDAYSQLEAMGEAPPPEEQPNPNNPPPEEKPETKVDAPKPEEKPVKAGELRANYEKLKKDFAGLQTKLKDLEAERTKQPAEDPEKKQLTETLQQREKRLAELEEEVRFTAFEKSGEYKEQYWTPFESAYNAGRAKVASLKLTDTESGTIRQGTAEDFDTLMRVTDDGDAAEMAAELFGNKAATVLYHREKVQELNNRRVNAIEEFRAKGGEREKQRSEQAQKQQKEIAELWTNENKAGVERFPKWFKPEEGDEKGNALLQRGFEIADAAFGQELKGPDGKPLPMTPQEMVKLHSAVRNKAAGFDRLAHKYGTAQKELTELKAKLKAYEDSEPTPGDGQRRQKAPPVSALTTAEEALTRLAT